MPGIFRRDLFALIAVALMGVVVTIYMVFGQTPFFPKSLLTTTGDCPGVRDMIPPHRTTVMYEDEASWLRHDLMSFHEAPLFRDQNRPERTVRFLLGVSDVPPFVVRTVETPDGHIRLIAKMPPGKRGCAEDGRGCLVDRMLTAEEAIRLKAAQAPLLSQASYGCHTGPPDGAMWVIEASGGGDYRYWQTQSPDGGELFDLAATMTDLTGWGLFDPSGPRA